MKKIVWVIGSVVLLLCIVVLSLPLFIDLNKHRAEIKAWVETHTNGEFNVEEIRLNGLGVDIKGLSLQSKGDFKEKHILSVSDAHVKLSFLSLLKFRPQATIYLQQPTLTAVKNEKTLFNFTELMKGYIPEGDKKSPSSPSKSLLLPAMILKAKLSFVMDDALLKYVDEKSGSTHEIEHLNVSCKNIVIGKPFDFLISALLSEHNEKKQWVEGKILMRGNAMLKTDADKKLKGVTFETVLSLGELTSKIEGDIQDMETLEADFKISTPLLSIGKVKVLFLPLRNFPMDGTFSFNGTFKGKLRELSDCLLDSDMKVHLQANNVDVDIKAELKNTLSDLSATVLVNAFQGNASLKGTADVLAKEPSILLNAEIQKMQLNSMLSIASVELKDVLTGVLSADIHLQGKGAEMVNFKKNLKGKGKIEIKDGELRGLNMAKSLQEELKLISVFAGTDVDQNFTGKFTSLRSSLEIENSKLHTPDAILEGKGYGAQLNGWASFDKEIKYKGKVLLPANKFKSKTIAAMADKDKMVGFPFTLEGKLPKYSFQIDTTEVAHAAAKKEVTDRLKQKIKEKIGIDIPNLPF